MKLVRIRLCGRPLLGSIILGFALPHYVQAQTEVFWSGTTSNSFNAGGNWVGNTAPGTTTSTNTNIAVFDNSSRAGSIVLGTARNLGGFRFTGTDVGSCSFADTNTNRFNLRLGGTILMEAAVPTGFGSNFTGDLTGSNFVTMTVIPEPASALLGGLGLRALLHRRPTRQTQATR